jgi:hypothetical protein
MQVCIGRDADNENDDDDIEFDKARPKSNSQYYHKRGKVAGLGVMAIVGVVVAILIALGFGFCRLWTPARNNNASQQTSPTGIAIIMIINIINTDVVNCVLGIVMLVFCGDEEVKEYLAK